MTKTRQPAQVKTVRCAIYTRKSTEEGLQQEFNSLDAQRESAEAFIKSQTHEGWVCLLDRYDDGGFTGGNMDRPAVKRLMADIESGKVDCVVVYKVDRLSRSLLDFARMMEAFERNHISFVSVTQQFNTTHSMGRLTLNILLSFAQFEREIISERTRDKMAATRRKGKWAGGHPVLGYDVDPRGFKLVVNEDEAARVRGIFELYLAHGSLLPVVEELECRGWRSKEWQTRKGAQRGGKPFTRTSLYKLLLNVVYIGKVRYKDEIHVGEHTGIVDAEVWRRVQTLLQRNGRTGGAAVRNRFGALLKGILRCKPCGCAMTPSHVTKRGSIRYRYYICSSAQKRGWNTCPSKSIPAGEIERFVVQQIRCIGKDPGLLAETLGQAITQASTQQAALSDERHRLASELQHWHAEIRTLIEQVAPPNGNSAAVNYLADLQERIRIAERRLAEIDEELLAGGRQQIDEREVGLALSAFEPVWESLAPREQARLVELLVERVDYDGGKKRVSITFHPTGIKALADEIATKHKEQSA